ncbi:MAG: UDP-3-O-acyl-N-acetylglucosamine deacetylase [Cyanobacteriota bacterium]|nr:UDP-3-O-acyl-N-acetylglucosamine deacetylase [Cyanobacteriota bacterium]
MATQHTLASEIVQSGIGLHSGLKTTVRVLPSSGDGRYFVRIDLPEQPIIPAKIESVISTTLSTELAVSRTNPQVSIRTVEHLLSALTGMGVDHARIEIDGPEVPLLDGSAKLWAEAIASVGLTTTPETIPVLPITQEITVRQGEAFVMAIPADETRFSYAIDFDVTAIGQQWYSWTPQQEQFSSAIAPARTFVLEHQVKQLQQAGLIKGGTLDNALVCGDDRWLNPPLRFSNEPVRHKILDLVGDLSLLGVIPQAHYLAYKAGHHLHTQLVQRINAAALAAL